MNELADLVRHERLARNWSVRRAATEGGISNTFWANFEDYRQPLTAAIAAAVAKAYGWDDDWASQRAPLVGTDHLGRNVALPDEISRLPGEVAALRGDVARLRTALTELSALVERELLDDEADEPPSGATPADAESS